VDAGAAGVRASSQRNVPSGRPGARRALLEVLVPPFNVVLLFLYTHLPFQIIRCLNFSKIYIATICLNIYSKSNIYLEKSKYLII
jgi:hypothetical protein